MSKLTKAEQEALSLEARRRVRRALQQIEEAQGMIGAACATLSSLCYANSEFQATSKLYDRVRSHWYKVRNTLEFSKKASKVRLDDLSAGGVLEEFRARTWMQP
jgi:hypothetical protein